MFFVCKKCGAQSPTGIGYVANEQTDFPAPRKGCPNEHADPALRLAALVMTEEEFVVNALQVFAARMDEGLRLTGAEWLASAVGARQAAAMFAENAVKARRLASSIFDLVHAEDVE